jgi:hypothetical protein
MSKWILVVFFALQAHFAASYLVPLDAGAQREFGGLLRWVWPWSYGDSGPLGRITLGEDLPIAGLFLAMIAAVLFGLAALAWAGVWVPLGWWRGLAASGAVLLICLMALFVGPTKLMPIVFALGTLYLVFGKPGLLGVE